MFSKLQVLSRRNFSFGIFAKTVSIHFRRVDGTPIKTITAKVGSSLLDNALNNDVEGIEGACGGQCACATCHMILDQGTFDSLASKPGEEEEDMLDLALDVTATSRLGCQVKVTKEMEGLIVKVPTEMKNQMLD